mgnify:CR=1 FL=1
MSQNLENAVLRLQEYVRKNHADWIIQSAVDGVIAAANTFVSASSAKQVADNAAFLLGPWDDGFHAAQAKKQTANVAYIKATRPC